MYKIFKNCRVKKHTKMVGQDYTESFSGCPLSFSQDCVADCTDSFTQNA